MGGRDRRRLGARLDRRRDRLDRHDPLGDPFLAKLALETILVDRAQAILDPMVGISAGRRLRVVDQLAVDGTVLVFLFTRRGWGVLADTDGNVDTSVEHRLSQ